MTIPAAAQATLPPQFSVTFPASLHKQPLQGRLYIMLSKNGKSQPRFQINDSIRTGEIFATQCNAWRPGQAVIVGDHALGYPIENLRNIPAGHYFAQALFNVYTSFHRADGITVKLPMDEGEGQQWNRKPGNLYSMPKRVFLHSENGGEIHLELSRVIPPLPALRSTRYLKYVRIESPRLSRFWGRPIYLGGMVMLPSGWYSHPAAHYPLIIYQGHFQRYNQRRENVIHSV